MSTNKLKYPPPPPLRKDASPDELVKYAVQQARYEAYWNGYNAGKRSVTLGDKLKEIFGA